MVGKTLVKTEKFKDANGIFKSYNYYSYDFGNTTVYEWRRLGKLNSPPDDLPALIYPNISYWYNNGNLHRKNGPAVINLVDGSNVWYQDGIVHRVAGPAIYRSNDNSYEEWYFHGKRHRNNGPAFIHGDTKHYWWKGKKYEFDEWAKLATLNKEEKIELVLIYG